METYHGHIRTQIDAILLFEACRLGFIPRIRRRLSERERLQIGSGCIYVWEENEASMKRWTDGKAWSASRVSGSFLTYREMEGNKRATVASMTFNESRKRKNSDEHGKRASPGSNPSGGNTSDDDFNDADGCRYKPNGLYKQSFSITTSNDYKLHLIAYYTKEDVNSGRLQQPSKDPRLEKIQIPDDFYPDTSSSGTSLTPPITTTPLVYAPYPTLPALPKAKQQQPKHHQTQPPLPPPPQREELRSSFSYSSASPSLSSSPTSIGTISTAPSPSHMTSPITSSSSASKPHSGTYLPPLSQLANSNTRLPPIISPIDRLPANGSKGSSINPNIKHSGNTITTLPLPKVLAEDHRALGLLNRVFL